MNRADKADKADKINKSYIWDMIEEEKESLIQLCSQMIAIPSENPPCNVEEIVKFICNYLNKFKIPYEVVRPQPNLPNIIAHFGNPDGKKIIFNGHCDVVPAGDLSKWKFPPFSGEVRDGKILGRGTSDMKCGLGATLFAVAMLAKCSVKLQGEVLLTIVPDEETGGFYGTKWLFEQGLIKGDWAIVAEPTGFDNIEIGQRGSLGMNVTASGICAHGSLSPYVGENAIEKLLRFLPELESLREIHGFYEGEMAEVMQVSKQVIKEIQNVPGVENCMDHVSVNYGIINGGVKRNVVADSAYAEVDIRIPLGVEYKKITSKVDEILDRLDIKGLTIEYNGARGGNYVSVEDPICKSAKKCAKELMDIDLIMAYQWASSDTRYFREAGISTIQYGPSDTEGIHTYNETVTIKDVVNAAKMYAGIILDLVG